MTTKVLSTFCTVYYFFICLSTSHFHTTTPAFPTQIATLLYLRQSFPTDNTPRLIATTPPAPRAPCTNKLPETPRRTTHSAPAQTHAPECHTPKITAGHALRMPAPGLPPVPRLHPAHPAAAAPATSPNSAAPLDTPHSALAAGVDTPQPAALCNCQLRVSQA